MEILVNGEPRMARTGQTVSELLAELSLDARLVVVELNREILRRGELSRVRLEPGDQVELVNFVGGG
ncbi:MAG: sulfur carrier protein ThiS [Gemmatimonadota bacterium]|nr:MAG: sulfur carrier protein ThiS [Gemmatimonadota bacterium]